MARIQILKHTGEGPEQGFRRCFQTDLTRSLLPSVVQARSTLVFCLFVYVSCQISFVDLTLFNTLIKDPFCLYVLFWGDFLFINYPYVCT